MSYWFWECSMKLCCKACSRGETTQRYCRRIDQKIVENNVLTKNGRDKGDEKTKYEHCLCQFNLFTLEIWINLFWLLLRNYCNLYFFLRLTLAADREKTSLNC